MSNQFSRPSVFSRNLCPLYLLPDRQPHLPLRHLEWELCPLEHLFLWNHLLPQHLYCLDYQIGQVEGDSKVLSRLVHGKTVRLYHVETLQFFLIYPILGHRPKPSAGARRRLMSKAYLLVFLENITTTKRTLKCSIVNYCYCHPFITCQYSTIIHLVRYSTLQ